MNKFWFSMHATRLCGRNKEPRCPVYRWGYWEVWKKNMLKLKLQRLETKNDRAA